VLESNFSHKLKHFPVVVLQLFLAIEMKQMLISASLESKKFGGILFLEAFVNHKGHVHD
jgi:hypothetical protein